jgi:toxin FitB
MVILDTNVISEMLTPRPNASVDAWLAEQPLAATFTTAVTKSEIFLGLRVLPEGRRRSNLAAAIQPIFALDFQGRILPFDSEAAEVYADIASFRRKIGRPISQSDGQIAAIALSRGASVATRDVGDFAEVGLTIINPWESALRR